MGSDSTSRRPDMAAEAPSDPRALLARNDMGRDEKVGILHQWEFDLREAMVAEEENMPAAEPPSFGLAEVLDALRALGATSRFHDVSTKHG